jgi:hypothetical protein
MSSTPFTTTLPFHKNARLASLPARVVSHVLIIPSLWTACAFLDFLDRRLHKGLQRQTDNVTLDSSLALNQQPAPTSGHRFFDRRRVRSNSCEC